MRTISVSTDVFAKIWSLRQAGEETENAILRRKLGCSEASTEEEEIQPPRILGFYDRRFNVHFEEGFEVFRSYLGTDYKARATGGHWVLLDDGSSHGSLNELSRAIGANIENAWVNWFYLGPDGKRRAVSDLRDPSKITRRKPHAHGIDFGDLDLRRADGSDTIGTEKPQIGDGTWRDDVREAIRRLGGKASLYRIYKEVEAIRRESCRSVPRTLEAVVRRTLEDHSSDSANYRGGRDLFCMPEGRGAGVWALRDGG